MTNLAKMTLAIFAAAFLASSPVLAADTAASTATAPTVSTPAKPDLTGKMKEKAAEMIQQGQKKADQASQKLQDALGVKKAQEAKDNVTEAKQEAGKKVDNAASDAKNQVQNATGKVKDEVVDVQQETVTVQTPKGTAQETTTVIVPEGAAKK